MLRCAEMCCDVMCVQGPFLAFIYAVKEMLEEGQGTDGSLPVNVAFVFEGEEENGKEALRHCSAEVPNDCHCQVLSQPSVRHNSQQLGTPARQTEKSKCQCEVSRTHRLALKDILRDLASDTVQCAVVQDQLRGRCCRQCGVQGCPAGQSALAGGHPAGGHQQHPVGGRDHALPHLWHEGHDCPLH